MCLWDSICNHCHPVKRSEDVIMEGAALPSVFNHAHRTAHSNQERQAEGCCLRGAQGGSPHLMGFSVLRLSLLPSKGSQAELAALTVTLPALVDWQMTEVFMQLGDQGYLPYPPHPPPPQQPSQRAEKHNCTGTAPAPQGLIACYPLSPSLPGKQKG